MAGVVLDVLPWRGAVARLHGGDRLPAWLPTDDDLWSVTRRGEELSIVCDEAVVPSDVVAERGWTVLAVRGPLDFGLTGVLASLATPLADAGVPIFALSTHDTDLVLVQHDLLDRAVAALRGAGHDVVVAQT